MMHWTLSAGGVGSRARQSPRYSLPSSTGGKSDGAASRGAGASAVRGVVRVVGASCGEPARVARRAGGRHGAGRGGGAAAQQPRRQRRGTAAGEPPGGLARDPVAAVVT